jgi:two-component system OmpR family response regulator
MTSLRILHVDDEPDIREVVELSLGLDPAFSVRSCASGSDALAAAADWSPDLILCDVMMPVMDGPATLARLRECPRTVNIPVVFMTARAQTRELEHFKSLGAIGVIAKPFDPMTLANEVRCHLRAAGLAALCGRFVVRTRADSATLTEFRVLS